MGFLEEIEETHDDTMEEEEVLGEPPVETENLSI